MKKSLFAFFFLLFLSELRAQCTAPSFSVDLSAQTDTTWILSGQGRGGSCCGSSNCITFTVTTNPGAQLISFDVTNPSPSGSAYYQVNCGTAVSIGTPLCIIGLPSPFTITYCKPGGDHPDYVIKTSTIVHASQDITLQKTGCVDTLSVTNVVPSSVVWTSIYPGALGAYNSYLSCTSGCTSTLVTPGPNPPPYVDFQVSGNNPNTACGPPTSKDTVRVYFVPNLTGTISPTNPIICASSGTQITLTANASGGATPYNYAWNTGPHTQSITVSAAGTYTVLVGDNTKCPKITLTKTISTLPSASFSYTGGSYCKNGTNPTPTYTNNGQAGVFTATPSGLVFVNTSTGEINLSASNPGTYTVTNSIAASNGCPNVSATATVTINPYPVMTSVSSATICTGSAVNINLTSSSAATYTWVANDNLNTTGESLTTQTTSVLSNTITNNTTVAQVVQYTVTPTSTLAGACTGPTQTVNVTVRPLDNAGFSYSSSTFCQTATYPTPTVTGLSGGTFSGSAGLIFSNSSNGTINLSGTPVGSYTVTYTTNGACPNAATFPVTITLAPSAVFSYAGPYCQNATNPFPTFGSGASGGTFTSAPGLVFVNTSTGEINLSASTPGTYTVTNSIPSQAGCAPASATGTVIITQLKDGTFSYTGSPYCQNAANPSPTFGTGAVAGTFSSQAGLTLNASTGQINLSTSAPGTYTVTNTIAAVGGCPAVVNSATIAITPLPIATFTYAGTPYCSNGSNPLPTFIGGGTAGVFSASSVFLNLNTSTGAVNLSSSQPGSYLVTNTFPAAGGCPQVSATASITITALPLASFSYAASPYCQNGSDPTPVLVTNGTNGTYTATPSGLIIDPNAGTVDLSASTAGIYTVTNNVSAAAGCPAVIATSTIAITTLPIGTFTYSGTPYCINAANPLPTFTGGGTAGTFSSSSALNLNSSTGQVTLSSSSPGTYTVANTIASANGCPQVTEQVAITVLPMDDPTFGYPGSTFCQTGVDPNPNISGLSGGTFTSGSLNINASTGVIDLSASPLGTYTVTYTTAGACPNASSVLVTITNAPSAAFGYAASPYCSSGTNPVPTFSTGASGGVFSSGGGLVIDSLTGQVNLNASTPGNYTVTNTIAASGGCATATATSVLVINPAATVNANIDQTICFGTSASLSGSFGGGASSSTWSGGTGTFSPNASTPNASYIPTAADSLAGTITLTLTTNDPAGVCPAVNDAMSITISQPATANANVNQTICYGSNVTLSGAIGGSASSATWSGGSGSFTPSDSTLNAMYIPTSADSTAGNITLTLTTNDPAGVCPSVSNAMILTINQPATSNANLNQTVCYGTPINLSGNVGGSASSGTWSGGTGSFSPNASTLNASYIPTAADSTTGVAVLVLTTNDPAGICAAVSDTMVVTINQPALVSAGADQTICYGTPVSLSGVIGGSAISATWTGGNGTYTPNDSTVGAVYIPSAADSAAGTITLTITTNDPAGVCPSLNDAMSIIINQPATAAANVDQTICYGSSVTLNGSVGGSATSGTWSGGGGAYAPNSSSLGATYTPIAADSASGTIALVLTTDDPTGVCPAVTDTMLLSINQPATVNANADQTICYGSSVSLAGTLGGSATGVTWTGGNGTFNPNSTTANATYVPNVSDSLAGTITLTLTTNDPNGVCPSVNDVMNITINQPAISNASANQIICYGNAVTLNGSIGGSATNGTWSGGSGSYSPNAGTLNATYTPTTADSAAGIITLTLTTDDPAGVCNAVSDAMTITIYQPATVNASVDQTICYGSAVTLAGAYGGSANSATWSGGAGNFSPNSGTLNATYTPSSADSSAGTITLTLTSNDPNGVCTAVTDQMTITINQPATANASVDQTICYGGTVTLNGSVGGSATSGAWSGGSGNFSPNAGTLNASYTPTTADSLAGSVTLTLTTDDPSGVCSSVTDVMNITVNPLPPVPTLASQSYTYCQSDPVAPVTAGGNGTFTWSSNPSMSPVLYTGTTFTPGTLTSGATTTFYVQATYSTGCTSQATNSVAITINNNPATPTISATSYTYCQTSAVGALTSTGTNPIWSTNPTMSPVINIGNTYTPSGLNTGVNTFYIIDSSAAGCKSVSSATVSVTIYNNPTIVGQLVVDSANCGLPTGGVTGVVVSNGAQPYTYQWYNGTTAISGATADSLTGVNSGTYSVLVTDAHGCVASGGSTIFTVGSSSNISSAFVSSVTSGNVPLNVVFAASAPATTYSWSLGNGSFANTTSTSTTYTAIGSYTVTLTTTNGTCVSTTTQTIDVIGEPTIVIPNIFTPNGDGINDIFTITSMGLADLHSDIYNRWGTLIHTLDGIQAGWDGKNQHNQDMSEGTYFVILKAKAIDGKTYEKQGYITLTR